MSTGASRRGPHIPTGLSKGWACALPFPYIPLGAIGERSLLPPATSSETEFLCSAAQETVLREARVTLSPVDRCQVNAVRAGQTENVAETTVIERTTPRITPFSLCFGVGIAGTFHPVNVGRTLVLHCTSRAEKWTSGRAGHNERQVLHKRSKVDNGIARGSLKHAESVRKW